MSPEDVALAAVDAAQAKGAGALSLPAARDKGPLDKWNLDAYGGAPPSPEVDSGADDGDSDTPWPRADSEVLWPGAAGEHEWWG